MGQILLKSASFIFLIALGYVLKRIGFFGSLDYKIPVKMELAITVFAPIGMVSSALAETIGGNPAVIAGTNSLSILLSVPSIIGLLAIFGVL